MTSSRMPSRFLSLWSNAARSLFRQIDHAQDMELAKRVDEICGQRSK